MNLPDEPGSPVPSGWLGTVAALVARVVPARFVRFAVVGVSGMVLNMSVLFVLADVLGVHTNVSVAVAIETSIVSNFVLNDRWTFADRRQLASGWWVRLVRFHAVAAVGAVIQAVTFLVGNYLIGLLLLDVVDTSLVGSIAEPPPIGPWKYASQFVGIGLAALWNFLANLGWTWRQRDPSA